MARDTETSMMELALAEARNAAARGEVPVGVVITGADGAVLASVGNRMKELGDPTAHAEMIAIRAACAATGDARLDGCDLHVTPLESLRSLLRGAEPAGPFLVVIHCEPGAASAIARAFEAENPSGIVGSIAGDDTVFVALDSAEAAGPILELIHSLI